MCVPLENLCTQLQWVFKEPSAWWTVAFVCDRDLCRHAVLRGTLRARNLLLRGRRIRCPRYPPDWKTRNPFFLPSLCIYKNTTCFVFGNWTCVISHSSLDLFWKVYRPLSSCSPSHVHQIFGFREHETMSAGVWGSKWYRGRWKLKGT